MVTVSVLGSRETIKLEKYNELPREGDILSIGKLFYKVVSVMHYIETFQVPEENKRSRYTEGNYIYDTEPVYKDIKGIEDVVVYAKEMQVTVKEGDK